MPQYQGIWTLQDAARLQSQQQWVTDPLFENTTLLLQADNAANAAQNNTFLDSSSNNFTITRNGNTTQGTFTPFSATGWSNFFTRASSQYLTVSNSTGDFSFGTGAFTIECWVNLVSMPSSTGYPASYWIFGGGPVNLNPGIDFYINNTQIGFNLVDFTSPTAIGNHGISVGGWYHVAVVRGGGSNQTLSIYVNGSRVATASSVTATADVATTGIAISAAEPSGATSGNFDGYISNYRIVKGTAIYDPTLSTLTVPTSSLTAVSNTVLLTCQSNRFIDTNTQATAKTITPNGTPSVQPFAPFAPQYQYTPTVIGGSGYFDGAGDYLTSASLAALGTGNFTFECWCYPTSTSSFRYLFSIGGDSNFTLALDSGTYRPYFYVGTTIISSSVNLIGNQWNHVALVRAGTGANQTTLYVNGVSGGSATFSTSIAAGIGYIAAQSTGSYPLTGYLSNLRLTNTAVYTAAFTPPTAPLTSVSGTQLLLNFTNAAITDGTMKNNLETVGNAQVSTSVVKYGTGSMYFDGSGDALTLPNSPVLQLGSADYTMEFWAYRLAATNMTWIFLDGNSSNYAGLRLDTDTSGNIFLLISTSGSAWAINTSGTAVLPTSTWTHIAVVRFGTSIRLYVNGISQISTTLSGAVTAGTSQQIGANFGATQVVNGYVDDLRLTLGIARYTANFTPPQVALPRQ